MLLIYFWVSYSIVRLQTCLIKRPTRDACLCMGDLQAPAAPPAPHFCFPHNSVTVGQIQTCFRPVAHFIAE